MSTYNYASTTAGSSYGITLEPDTADRKPSTPGGLIVTQAVQTRDGWLGQVIVDKTIAWESAPCAAGDDAIQEANSRVVAAITRLMVDDAEETT